MVIDDRTVEISKRALDDTRATLLRTIGERDAQREINTRLGADLAEARYRLRTLEGRVLTLLKHTRKAE